MKVAIISSHINKSLQLFWMHEEFLRLGLDTIHINIQIDNVRPQLADDLETLGIPVYILKHKNLWSYFKNIIQTRKLLKKHNINIVHTTLPLGNVIGQSAAILAKIKNRLTTCENASWANDFKNKKQWLIDYLTFKSAKVIITGADSATEYIENNWNIKHSKLVTIYNGVKESEYLNISDERIKTLKKQLEINDGDFIIGMVARLEFWKGHAYAIEAMKQVVLQFPYAKLLIFGSGGSEQDLILKQIVDSGLSAFVFYKGFVNDPICLFRLFNVQVHVPINKYVENCGLVILEGMISGCPQVLTASGYASTSAKNMNNSLVVDFCNSNAISRAIIKLIENPDLAKQLGMQAKEDALAQFRSRTKAEKHIALYKKFL